MRRKVDIENNSVYLTSKFIAKRISLYQNTREITKIYTRY